MMLSYPFRPLACCLFLLGCSDLPAPAFEGDQDAGSSPKLSAVSLAVGSEGNVAIDAEGRAYYWGSPGKPPALIGDEDGRGHFSDWEAFDTWGYSACGLRPGGQLWCSGYASPAVSENPTLVPGLTTVKKFSVGAEGGCAIVADGSLWCWGRHDQGLLGIGEAEDLEDCRGYPCSNTPRQVGSATDWEQIAVGYTAACGIRTGAMYCWGTSASFFGDDRAATDCTHAVGAPKCFLSPVGAFAEDGDWVEVAAGAHHVCARRSNGDVHCRGLDDNTGSLGSMEPVLSGATSITAGDAHNCAIADGQIWCWGDGGVGALGDGLMQHPDAGCMSSRGTCSAAPVKVPAPPSGSWLQVGAGREHTCAIASDQSVFCWGNAAFYALGVDPDSLEVGGLAGRSWVPVPALAPAACGTDEAKTVLACGE